MATLINTARLNDIDPQVWLADVLSRIADTPVRRLGELLPWHWNMHSDRVAAYTEQNFISATDRMMHGMASSKPP